MLTIPISTIVADITATVKKDETKIKDFLIKVIPAVIKVGTIIEDVLAGKTPPTTGNVDADRVLQLLATLAPYYLGSEGILISEIGAIITALQNEETKLAA